MRSFLLILLCIFTAGCSGHPKAAGGVDLDFTNMSATMVYAEIYNMTTIPGEYLGKTVKADGSYDVTRYDGQYYHFIIIEDASACCQQGLEFRLDGDYGYPRREEKIEVTGVFESYDMLGDTYYYLAVDDITVLE
ncbi:MAG: hypothetical protein FWH06_05720 [Oscillospiraceae bacterium]|nr:hypothetical protein [Oscillospiraceae bacterium]